MLYSASVSSKALSVYTEMYTLKLCFIVPVGKTHGNLHGVTDGERREDQNRVVYKFQDSSVR